MVSKVMEVVAVGLVPHPACWLCHCPAWGLHFTGALFSLPQAGERYQPVPVPAPSSPGDGLDPGERGGETGSGHPYPSARPRELLTNKLAL